MNLFEVKVCYDKILENGEQKKVTEPYLVDALSCTEAEARIVKELEPYMLGDFKIPNINYARISELFFHNNGDRYYKAKVQFIMLDERSGREKRTSVQMLICATNIDEAHLVLKKGMTETMADYVVAGMVETPILDVFLCSQINPIIL